MTPELVISGLSAVVAVAAATFAWQSAKRARETLMYSALRDLINEYRSPEMFVAVKALWRFRREHGSNMTSQYKMQRLRDSAHAETLAIDDRIAFERGTIHYQRRLVSGFYVLLATLNERNLPGAGVIYDVWDASDLEIIPEVLIPLQSAVGTAIDPASDSPVLQRLMNLYAGHPRAARPAQRLDRPST